MKEILDKISSYNLFNYLLPGTVFAVLATKLTKHSMVQGEILSGAFLYYFIGLVVSRIGSLFVEPILKMIAFIRFADYLDYVSAVKRDPNIEVLSEANNTYRTICSLLILLLSLMGLDWLEARYPVLESWETPLLLLMLLVIFLFSYRKQTSYITSRITSCRPEQTSND
jgi:hypothetical protein